MKRRVVVTGTGVAVGPALGRKALAEMCLAGQGSLRQCTAFDPAGLSTDCFGEMAGLTYDEKEPNGRFLKILELSAKDLLHDAGLAREDIAALGTGCRLFFGTLIFSADAFYRHSMAKRQGQQEDSFIAHMNDFTAYARELLGVQGSAMIVSSSCASGTTAAGMALDYIRNGLIDCAVVGGVDALSLTTAYGFNALKSMSAGVANPFDASRDGINIGECGALFFFESLEHAQARGARIQGEVVGYAISNDAYHITSPRPDGEGACLTMQAALEDAGLRPEDIGYIDAHGTGTQINDSMEAKALTKLFGGVGHEIGVSSTKALVGHCMGASGAVELAAVLLALQEQRSLPLPRLTESILEIENLRLGRESQPIQAEYAIKNSFAFSGNSAALIVRRAEEAAQ